MFFVRCLAAALAFVHCLLKCDNPKCLQTLSTVPCGGRGLFPLKTTTLDTLFLCSLSGRKFSERVGKWRGENQEDRLWGTTVSAENLD